MMNRNRKGFTIVELVIVIAVIAILAAVLIPTFASIIRKANISADTQLAKTLNTALTVENVDNDIDDIYEVIDALNAQGFILANLNAKANECYYAWEKETNQIVLVDGKDGYKVIFALNEEYGAIDDSWYFVINDAELAAKVKADYATANVLSFFETPGASQLSAPHDALKALIANPADAVADDNLYVALETNGAAINAINIGGVTYDANSTFKVSIGQDKWLEYNYFKTIEGKISIPAILVAFDAEAKYGVVDGTLVMNSGTAAEKSAEFEVYLYVNSEITKLEKNAAGKYVISIPSTVNANQVFLSVYCPDADLDSTGYYISKKNTAGRISYGYDDVDDLSEKAGIDDYGYWTYVLSFTNGVADSASDPKYDGRERSLTVYFNGYGYVSLDYVIDVQ